MPVTELVELIDRYTAKEWEIAADRAASQDISDACALLARVRRNRP